MSTSWKRWIPVAVVPLAVAATAVALPLSASAAGDLPEKSASELLTFVAENDVTAFSGEVEQTSDLGLPDLSALGGSDGSSASAGCSPTDALMEFATGPHQARVFVDLAQGARLQVLDRLAERDIVATRADGVWIYDSSENTATHLLPSENEPSESTDSAPAEAVPGGEVLTPSALAERLLASIDPSTSVAVGSDVRVAGRDAYELVLTPHADDTLVGRVSVSVDGETGLPLGVSVTAKGGTAPAFSVAYSSIDLSAPDSTMFAFTPPAGADVTEETALAHEIEGTTTSAPGAPDGGGEPVVTGTGWGAIVELPAADTESFGALDAVTTPVDGGRVLSSALVTVLVTDDGRVLAGAVPVDALLTAAAAR